MATDVANAIIRGSAEAFKEHCQSSSVEVQITMRRERPTGAETFILLVTPMDSHVLIQYGSLRFRAPRADGAAFRDMLSSLYGMLADKSKEADKADEQDPNTDFEEWHYHVGELYFHQGIEADPYHDARFLMVQQGEVQVDLQRVAQADLEGVFMHHMGAMRFLSC